ncbi:hypothetical protein THARTR1_01933 [Trichoderma harzianum]|uniref:Extracellular protein n=1 Tax=Trichoderma harzianum TaxID=5544 RepID=A0A2K0UJ43_TRIHA|nr:hypothetical protein THARTR1_01933 [Trichoderma harzianum]
MKLTETIVAAVLGLAAVANGHMEMMSPPPLRSRYNKLAVAASSIDYDMVSPLLPSGADFPCKGYHNLLGTAAGASVATWAPGGSYSFTVTGGANHEGGSCQASLSYDKGQTFKVIHSYIGACPPIKGDSSFQFTVPTDAPAGEAMFAWTWFNKIGNREMYMNCAAVTIGAGKKRDASTPFSSRPDMFVANVGNGVCTYETKDVQFPNPGTEVDNNSQGTAPPGEGKCIGAPPAEAPPAAPPAGQPVASSVQAPVAAPPQATQPVGTSAPAPKIPGGVFITSPVGQPPAQPTAKPTTLVSLTSQAPAVTSPQPKTSPPPAAATSAAAPAPAAPPAASAPAAPPAPQPSKPASGGSSPSNGAVTAGSACSSEGQWSCASDGKSFQRCASGMWSASMPVAPGTSCQPGTSDSLTLVNKRSGYDFVRRRRFVSERFQRERALA